MTDNNIDQNSIMFISLVSSLGSQVWIQMGKMKNPATDKIERNLDAASMSIDMLAMLKEKTSGNLSDEENNLLESTLSDLRMNFVQESGKEPEEEKTDETVKKIIPTKGEIRAEIAGAPCRSALSNR